MFNKKVMLEVNMGEELFAVSRIIDKYSKKGIYELFDNKAQTCAITFYCRTYDYRRLMTEIAELLLNQK